jgi:hypothetical protein
MKWRRVLSVLAATLSATAPMFVAPRVSEAAAPKWTSPVVVVDPRCQPDFGTAVAASGAYGLVHGFANYVRGTCGDSSAWYFQGTAGRWTQTRSPYQGDVLAVADDGTSTWILYLDGRSYDRVLLGRRLHTGRWFFPPVLSRLVGSAVGSGVQGASLVASGGRWWAVWAQALPDPQSSSPATTLFQAKTLGGTQSAHRITSVTSAYPESRPALALTRDAHGRPTGAVLAWARDVGSHAAFVENDELWCGRAGLGGRWTTSTWLSVPAAAHPYALTPALARVGGTTWMAWARQSMDVEAPVDSRVLVTSDPAHAGSARPFATGGSNVVVAATTTRVDLAWQATDVATIAVATRKAGRWSARIVQPGPDEIRVRPLLVTSANGRLTVLFQSQDTNGRLFAITER